MKVAVLSTHDWANSGWKISQALKEVGIESECFVRKVCHFFKDRKFDKEKAQNYIRGCDAVIFKGDHGIIDPFYGSSIAHYGIPIFCAFGGSSFLKNHREIVENSFSNKLCKGLVALRPDLRLEKRMVYIGHPIDTNLWSPLNYINGSGKKLIGHFISNKSQIGLKGTEAIKKAVSCHKDTAILDFAMNISFDEVRKRKMLHYIYVESIGFRYFGNNAVESMALGIPTIAEVPKFVLDMNPGFKPYGIVNANAKNLSRKLGIILKDGEHWKELSQQALDYVNEYHNYTAVGNMWKKFMEERL